MRDLMGLMKQAQQLQQKMQELQAELETQEVEGVAGGGLVRVRLTAKGEMRGLSIDPSLVKPDESEILEDLIVAAHNDARVKADALKEAAGAIRICSSCGNIDTTDPCAICRDPRRDRSLICVVEDVGDLWALERAGAHAGRYHVLGGTLSPLDGIGPEDLNLHSLVARAQDPEVREVILAVNATVEGQTTAHYVTDLLANGHVRVSRLAHGVPIGGELDYLDEGTLAAAVRARQPF